MINVDGLLDAAIGMKRDAVYSRTYKVSGKETIDIAESLIEILTELKEQYSEVSRLKSKLKEKPKTINKIRYRDRKR